MLAFHVEELEFKPVPDLWLFGYELEYRTNVERKHPEDLDFMVGVVYQPQPGRRNCRGSYELIKLNSMYYFAQSYCREPHDLIHNVHPISRTFERA